MATRIKDGEVPYTGGIGIEITNNHVINVLLRELNNLIHVNEDRELYVDLQLDAGIAPDDDFPVGVTTGEILAEDGWPQNGTIINWKTTSGDYTRIIYANDGKLYYDPGTGVWNQFLSPGDLTIATASEPGILKLGSDTVQTEAIQTPTAVAGRTYALQLNSSNQGMVNVPWTDTTYQSKIEDQGGTDVSLVTTGEKYIWNHKQDQLTAGTRISITVDSQTGNTVISADVSGILTYKGNVSNIADLPSSGQSVGDTYFVEGADAMYSWDGTQWNLVGSTAISLNDYFNKTIDDSDDITQGTTNLFCTTLEKNTWNNKQDTIIAGDNITIGLDGKTINAASYYAGTGLSLNNYTFNNTKPFDPANQGSLGWLLQKTSDGYEWRQPNFVTSVNGQTGAVTVDEFDPSNEGVTGQVLKKTADGYEWSNEKAGVYEAGDGIEVNNATKKITNTAPFEPTNQGVAGQVIKLNSDGTYSWQNDNTGGGGGGGGGGGVTSVNGKTGAVTVLEVSSGGNTGQVLTKKANGYGWMNIELPSGENNVKFWTLNSNTQDPTTQQEIYEWLLASPNNGAIINDTGKHDVFVFYKFDSWDTAIFYGTKRVSEMKEWQNSDPTQPTHGWFTSQYQWELDIFDGANDYNILVKNNDDDDTHTNYLSALGAEYPAPFMPVEGHQPATKAYVDAVAAGSVSVNAITSNTSGTTYSASQIWVGTQAQYDALVSGGHIVNGVIYNIIPSS